MSSKYWSIIFLLTAALTGFCADNAIPGPAYVGNDIGTSEMLRVGGSIRARDQIVANTAGNHKGSGFLSTSVVPGFAWNETDAPADGRTWDAIVNDGSLSFRALNDGNSTGHWWMAVHRSGTSVTKVALQPSGGAVTIGGDLGGSETLRVVGSIRAKDQIVANTAGNHQGSGFLSSSVVPGFAWNETDAPVDGRTWDAVVNEGLLSFRALNDANSIGHWWMSVYRSGTSVTKVALQASGGVVTIGGDPGGSETLRVGGSIRAHDILVQSGNIGIGPVVPIRQLHFGNSSGAEMVMEKTTALANYKKWNFFVGGPENAKSALLLRQLNDSGTDGAIATTWDGNGTMSIYGAAPDAVEAGRVAIGGGKISANEARVNGLITAKEIRVTLSVWADSVFSASYRLPSLSEVSTAIQRDGHLPGIPSEKEVVAEGLSVGDMSRLHMGKIEELTLYAIDADRRLQSAQNDIVTLTAQRDAIAIRLARLEAAVELLSRSSN